MLTHAQTWKTENNRQLNDADTKVLINDIVKKTKSNLRNARTLKIQ